MIPVIWIFCAVVFWGEAVLSIQKGGEMKMQRISIAMVLVIIGYAVVVSAIAAEPTSAGAQDTTPSPTVLSPTPTPTPQQPAIMMITPSVAGTGNDSGGVVIARLCDVNVVTSGNAVENDGVACLKTKAYTLGDLAIVFHNKNIKPIKGTLTLKGFDQENGKRFGDSVKIGTVIDTGISVYNLVDIFVADTEIIKIAAHIVVDHPMLYQVKFVPDDSDLTLSSFTTSTLIGTGWRSELTVSVIPYFLKYEISSDNVKYNKQTLLPILKIGSQYLTRRYSSVGFAGGAMLSIKNNDLYAVPCAIASLSKLFGKGVKTSASLIVGKDFTQEESSVEVGFGLDIGYDFKTIAK